MQHCSECRCCRTSLCSWTWQTPFYFFFKSSIELCIIHNLEAGASCWFEEGFHPSTRIMSLRYPRHLPRFECEPHPFQNSPNGILSARVFARATLFLLGGLPRCRCGRRSDTEAHCRGEHLSCGTKGHFLASACYSKRHTFVSSFPECRCLDPNADADRC